MCSRRSTMTNISGVPGLGEGYQPFCVANYSRFSSSIEALGYGGNEIWRQSVKKSIVVLHHYDH